MMPPTDVCSRLTGRNVFIEKWLKRKGSQTASCLSRKECYLELKEHISLHCEAAMCADKKKEKSQAQVLTFGSSGLFWYGFDQNKKNK